MKHLWFRAHTKGWGWYPATWQGWVVLSAFILVIAYNFIRLDSYSHSVSDLWINFIPQTVLLAFALAAICYKTGEKPHWWWRR